MICYELALQMQIIHLPNKKMHMMCNQPDCGLAIFQRVEYHILHHVIASGYMGGETDANVL